MNRNFIPSGRNPGGKLQIERLQQKHLLALINSKPCLDIKQPHQHVDHNRPYSAKSRQNYNEINETYRRIKALKGGYCNTEKPKTFDLKSQLKVKNKVSQQVAEQDHANNVKALVNNIAMISERSNRKIKVMRTNSRIHSIANSIKENSRIHKKEWDERSTHPFEHEWRAKKRPQSAVSKSKSSAGETLLLSNIGTLDSSTVGRKNHKYALDYMDVGQGVADDEDFIIKQESTTIQQQQQQQQSSLQYEKNHSQHQHQIYDKQNKRDQNVMIPVVGPNENLGNIKRKIYQTLMDYKLFQRHQVYQIGQAFVDKNEWLDNEEILNECNKISKQLYGID